MKIKLIASSIMLTLLCLLGSCDDKLEVQQAYDFSLTSWYLQKTISPDETVEIRLTLNRSGNYEEARYQIGYIQIEGSGEVYDKKNIRLVNREMQPLIRLRNWRAAILAVKCSHSSIVTEAARTQRLNS